MQVSDFDYNLPEELIAQTPLEKRDESRLLVYNRQTDTIEHRQFKNIIDYLSPKDCLVLNNTRVLPARLLGNKKDSGGKVEFVLLKNISGDKWEVLVNPGRRIQPGHVIEFGDGLLEANVLERCADGNRIVEFKYDGVWQEVLNSDDTRFGGTGLVCEGEIRTEDIPMHGLSQSATLTLPPLGAVILTCKRKFPRISK